MANSNRTTQSYLSVIERKNDPLFQQGLFSFIRYLEANSPLSDRVGYSLSPKKDFARFGQKPLLHFFPAAFTDVRFSPAISEYKIRNSYIGMLGINGPLPLHLTEYAIERQQKYKDSTFSEFLNIFNHRFISLFYRAWADSEPTVSHDRKNQDLFSKKVNAISGSYNCDTNKIESNNLYQQYLAGLLSHKNKSGKVLIEILAEVLGFHVELEEFCGKWYEIPEYEKTKLGQSNAALGQEAVVGERTFQRSHNFSILIGPLSFDEYVYLLKNQEKIDVAIRIAKRFLGHEYDFSIKLMLKKNQSRPSRLGQSRLGLTSWCQGELGYLNQNNVELVYTREC